MFDWLIPSLGFAGVGLGLVYLMGGMKILDILSPAIKGIFEGIVTWANAVWHGVKTSNYGTWTLIGTAVALTYLLTPCPECKQVSAPKASISKGVSTTPKTVTTTKDVTCHWLGCLF